MKCLIVALLCVFSLSLNAQTRNVQMEYKIVDPYKHKEIRINESIPVSVRFYNYGPDTLWTCDSFLMYFSVALNYTGTQQHKIFILEKPLFPGDSSNLITDTAHWEWPFELKTDRYQSLNMSLALFATDYNHPKGSYVNISGVEGQKDNSKMQLMIRVKTASLENVLAKENQNIILYPNPIAGRTISVQGVDASTIKTITCTDVSGRIMICAFDPTKDRTEITLPCNLAGVYFMTIYTTKSVFTKKVIIQN